MHGQAVDKDKANWNPTKWWGRFDSAITFAIGKNPACTELNFSENKRQKIFFFLKAGYITGNP